MPFLCKAAVADGHGSFTIETIEVGSPAADEALVQVKAAGLCHTDYDSLSWGKPIIMGHEGAGIIQQVGSQVKHFAEGDEVIFNWATPCGTCFQCQIGNPHICEQNSPVVAGGNGYTPGHAHLEGTLWQGKPIERSFNLGTLSEYTLVKTSALVEIREPMPFPAASIISCGVMTGYGSVVNAAQVKAGSSVVVLGAGGVGLNVIQGARNIRCCQNHCHRYPCRQAGDGQAVWCYAYPISRQRGPGTDESCRAGKRNDRWERGRLCV